MSLSIAARRWEALREAAAAAGIVAPAPSIEKVRLQVKSEADERRSLQAIVAQKAPIAHVHPVADVAGLEARLTALEARVAALERRP